MKKTAQTDLDEYIFTRPEMAKLLNISTNALRMRMRKGKCDLDYRFDGKQFKFKRPPKDRVNTMMDDHQPSQPSQQKKILNRGATHKGLGKYPNEAFKRHNEMKILNSIHGKFKSEAHRKEFEKLNEKALEQTDENVKKEENRAIQSQFKNPNKYGGMLTAKGIKNQDDQLQDKLNRSYYNANLVDPSFSGDGSFNIRGKDYTDPFAYKSNDGSVEVDPRDFPEDDKEPEFSSKVQESIWRLKNKK